MANKNIVLNQFHGEKDILRKIEGLKIVGAYHAITEDGDGILYIDLADKNDNLVCLSFGDDGVWSYGEGPKFDIQRSFEMMLGVLNEKCEDRESGVVYRIEDEKLWCGDADDKGGYVCEVTHIESFTIDSYGSLHLDGTNLNEKWSLTEYGPEF